MKKIVKKTQTYIEYCKEALFMTAKAEALVKERIKGDRKGMPGEPNYLHSFRVRDLVSASHHWDDPDYELFMAALLHDVVEDGGVSYEELKKLGFSERVIQLVGLCSHDASIEDKTKRWFSMMDKLAKADDKDAWTIKLADMSDNLSQSRGLSPENRKFMVEAKAPLLLRLAGVSKYPPYKIGELIEEQRSGMAKVSRYVVTRWVEDFDYDGLTNDFAVLGNFEDKCEAEVCAVTETEKFVRERLDVKTDWNPIMRDAEVRQAFRGPNRMNKVIFARSAARKNPSGYDSLYVFTEVVQVPFDTVVDDRLFNPKDCDLEVSYYFNGLKAEKDRKEIIELRKGIKSPTKCHLWNKVELVDADLDNAFDVLRTFTDEAHLTRRLIKCKMCGQLYLKEFYEQVDWVDGDDPQYVTYIPVSSWQEAETINKASVNDFQSFQPRINRDWPKGKSPKIYWQGRNLKGPAPVQAIA